MASSPLFRVVIPFELIFNRPDSDEVTSHARITYERGKAYAYTYTELVEPDHTRFPSWRSVSIDEWNSVQWQRSHCVKQLCELMGDPLDESFYLDLEKGQAERATISMPIPPQMMNTMAPRRSPTVQVVSLSHYTLTPSAAI